MAGVCYEHSSWQAIPDFSMHPGGVALSEQAFALCELASDVKVLDIGCGCGTTLRHLLTTRDIMGFGFDVSLKLLRQAKNKNPNMQFVQTRAERLPLANQSFDVIISECALSLQQAEIATQECARILRENGYLLVSDLYVRDENGIPALQALLTDTCISRAMPQKKIVSLLERCDLKIIAWKDYSEYLSLFPICTLTAAANIDPFDLHIAAAKAKLGYYFLIARKINGSSEGGINHKQI